MPVPVFTASADFTLPTGIAADLTLTADAIDYRGGVIRQSRLEASLANGAALLKVFSAQMPGGSDLSLSGTVTSANGSPQFSGRADFVSDNLRGTLGWLGADSTIAADRLRKGSIGADITASPAQVQLTNWTMGLDTTRMRGGLTLLLRERPAFGLALDLGKINLDAYLPPEGQADKTQQASETGTTATDAPSPLAQAAIALNSFDANVRIGFDEITVRKTRSSADSLRRVFRTERFPLADCHCRSAGATVNLKGSLAGAITEPNTELEFDISAKSVARLARLAGLEPNETLQRIGAATVSGNILGDLSALTIDAMAEAAGASASVKGILYPLAQPLNVDLAIKLQHESAEELASLVSPDLLSSDMTLGSVAVAATVVSAPDSAYGLDATMDIGGGKLSLKGTVGADVETTAIALDTRYSHPDIVALIRSLPPAIHPRNAISARQHWSAVWKARPPTWRSTDYALASAQFRYQAKPLLAFTGPRPKLTLAAESGTIAIDPWLPGETAVPSGGVAPVVPVKRHSRTWSRETIDIGITR